MRISKIKNHNSKGLFIALLVVGMWATSLIFLLTSNVSNLEVYYIIPGILVQAFLYTGLFITAHDAMHGTVFPQNRRLNDTVGTVAVFLYALFSYRKLHEKHWEHHRHPAGEDDPDFHDGEHKNFFSWYFHFMKNYMSFRQLLGMAIAFNILRFMFGIPELNLVLFWVIPAFASTFQLFYFGTYLPHRENGGYPDKHKARSNDYSIIWSFITCYHFGYHWEHHEYPHIPWWHLPVIRKEAQYAGIKTHVPNTDRV